VRSGALPGYSARPTARMAESTPLCVRAATGWCSATRRSKASRVADHVAGRRVVDLYERTPGVLVVVLCHVVSPYFPVQVPEVPHLP
jgi:hypothetical protein